MFIIHVKRYDYNLRRYVNTPREEPTCSVCVNKIEDECHLLSECEKNKASRKEFCRKIAPIKEHFATMNNSEKVQLLLSLSETEKGTTCEFSKSVFYTVLQNSAHIGLKQNVLRSIIPDIFTRSLDNAVFVCVHVIGRFSKDFSELHGLRRRGKEDKNSIPQCTG